MIQDFINIMRLNQTFINEKFTKHLIYFYAQLKELCKLISGFKNIKYVFLKGKLLKKNVRNLKVPKWGSIT